MKTLVSIPNDMTEKIEDYRKRNYPDLTIPKMLIRVIWNEMKKENAHCMMGD